MTNISNEIAQFDKAKSAIAQIKTNLDNLVITDQSSRDVCFTKCKDAASWRKRVDEKRLELIRPINDELKVLKDDYEAARVPLMERKKMIDEYAKDELLGPLNDSIDSKKQKIIAFDKEEEKRREAERQRLEKEKREREEKERKAKEEADRKAREKQKKIDDEKKEAEKLKGIARAKAQREADEKKRKAEEEAKAEQDRLDKEAEDRRKADQEKENELNKKVSGRVKVTKTFQVLDLEKVPDIYIIKTLDKNKVQEAIDDGVEQIPGIIIETHEDLKQK